MTHANPLDRFSVAGASVLITGATGALGSAASRGLAAAGANLTLAGGNAPALESLRSELLETVDTSDVTTVPIRPESEADATALVDAAVGAYGRSTACSSLRA